MLKTKIANLIVSIGVIAVLASCSNSTSPVSTVDKNGETTAAISDIQVQDIASAGYGATWALSFAPAPTGKDYYLLKYITNGGYWAMPGNYGDKVTVEAFGKCYHSNSNKEIWWSDGTKQGKIGAYTDLRSIDDIAAGRLPGSDDVRLWMLATDNLGKKRVKWFFLKAGTVEQSGADITPAVPAGNKTKISCDPNDGNSVLIVNSNIAIYSTNRGGSWTQQPHSGIQVMDGSFCKADGKIILRGTDNMIYKGLIGYHKYQNGPTGVIGTIAYTPGDIYFIKTNWWAATTPY